MLDNGLANLLPLLRLIRGVETTSISTLDNHAESDIHFLQDELSNSCYRAMVLSDEGQLVIRWRLIDPIVMVFGYGRVGFFLFAGCLAVGLIMFLPDSILVGLIGMPMTVLLSRALVMNWRGSPKAALNSLSAERRI